MSENKNENMLQDNKLFEIKNLRMFLAFLFFMGGFFVFNVKEVSAATYYASSSGVGTDCSELSPCTFLYAIGTKISTGDTIKVMPGTYNVSTQIGQKSATSDIIVEAYDVDNLPIFDGSGLSSGRLIYTYGGTFRYLVFKDVGRVSGYNRSVILTDDNAPSVVVEHNQFIRSGTAMEYKGFNDIFRYNYLYRTLGPADNGQDVGESINIYNNVFVGSLLAVYGTATGGDTDTLTNSSVNFTIGSYHGLYSGAIIKNINDNSWGVVKDWTVNNIEFVSPMSSGQWDAGDRYEIYGYVANSNSYALNINGYGTVNIFNNIFSGTAKVRIGSAFHGVVNVRNNLFSALSRGDENIESIAPADGTVNTLNNTYLNGSAFGDVLFTKNLDGINDSGLDSDVNWGVDPKVNFPDSYFFYRFDDTDYGACSECSDNYYIDIANKMKPYGQKAVVGVDVSEVGMAGNNLNWDQIRTLQDSYGWEIASHGMSHHSVDNSTGSTSPFSVSYSGGGTASIDISLSGMAPLDSGTITITENANSIEITYPALVNLLYTAQRTNGSDNDPWDYSVVNNGMADPSFYDLGSIGGLRDYLNSLTGWTATTTDFGPWDYLQNVPARELANDLYNSLDLNTPIILDVPRSDYWEMAYSKAVIEYELGNGYQCTTFIYPNFEVDYQAEDSLINYGYYVGLGYNEASGQNILDALDLFNVGTVMLNGIKSIDTYSDGSGGEESDIRHAIRSLVYASAGDRRISGLMSHSFSDILSMEQWDWIINEVANISYLKVRTAQEISSIVRNSGGWLSSDADRLWERSTWDSIEPTLRVFSPAIDSGTNVGLTTDYVGNPIYGLPDIGAYEYQPTHEMNTDNPQIGETIRIYGDGKFRNTVDDSNSNETTTANLSIIPQDSNTTNWIDLNISTWQTNNSCKKTWTENGDNLGKEDYTLHTVGDLVAGRSYNVKIDDTLATDNITGTNCQNGICTADTNGEITFTYTGGYSTHTFDIEDTDPSYTGVATEPSEDEEEDDNQRDLNLHKVKVTSTNNSITINWKTDYATKDTIYYGTNKNLKNKQKDHQKEKKHTLTLKDLLPNTTYYFKIKSTDGLDNKDTSRIHKIRTQAVSTPVSTNVSTNVSTSNNPSPSTCSYTVQQGDTLWNIAKEQLQDGTKYQEIIKLNYDKNTNILKVGDELRLCEEGKVEGVSDQKDQEALSLKDNSNIPLNEDNSQTKQPEEAHWWNPLSWF